MSRTAFILGLVALVPVLIAILAKLVGMIADEFGKGHRSTGGAMIGMIVAIVVAALPWWML